ncbi:MAG: type II CAAX prenyl endopeptidase Rce1 family protein [Actinomycetota bacterium]
MSLIVVLIAAGAVAQAVVWRLVVARRVTVWVGMGVTMGALGALSLLTGREHLSPRVDLLPAAGVGVVSGVALFAATRVFVRFAVAWGTFRRHTVQIYGNRSSVSLPVALVVAVALSAPGEELFWRGLAGGRLATATGSLVAGAAVALGGYVAVSMASVNLPVVASAIVGGGLWSLLFAWTGGVLPGLCSHVAFTGLMILLPPPAARAGGDR